ncbi:Mechanosensitive ion channel-domain-containing protein [Radiomyces spectabilis]|uniref:Mechanosensitive ion channel-domain-containing protein n=1 Tax=Radiomyces spectabilis TaxID=64574 RepID=UPI00222056A2|nr:Mechanosensitive ion channel-domain-containing protein [Radiomyces spectabilis]KAI8374423.1 Mechanosensitive ion channel-domain-containing protein [Radiomyces spectabilis]
MDSTKVEEIETVYPEDSSFLPSEKSWPSETTLHASTAPNAGADVPEVSDEKHHSHSHHSHHGLQGHGPPDDEDDDEFDWNDDPDQVKPKRRKTTRQRIQEAMRKPCCWHYLSPFMKRLIFAITGSCIFVIIAVCVNLLLPVPSEEEMNSPGFMNVRSNVQLWMFWAAFMWHIGWITTVIIEVVPSVASMWTKIFRGRRSERVKSTMEYYMSVKLYLGILIMASWNWGSWAFLVNFPYNSVKKQGYSHIIWNVFACIFAAACFLFVQKTIIQMIATRFHSFAYNDRLTENKNSLKILDSLSKAENRRTRGGDPRLRNRRSPQAGELFEQAYSTGVQTPSGRPDYYRQTTNSSDKFSQFQRSLKNIVLTDDPHKHSRIEKGKVDINSNEFAKKVAKKLFYSLAYPHGAMPPPDEDTKRHLYLQDFLPFFKTREEAEKAFAMFDKNGNGDLTRREFRDTVVQVYRERKALAQSMRDTSQVLGKIDGMLLLVSMIATIFVSLAIFNVDIWRSLVPLGSMLLALTFVFGNTAKNTFESILFIFVTHPYDAGDYVLIDDQFLLVHNMGLMGTVFIRGDGQTVYAPTTVLMTKLISNVRRSGNMGETVIINIDFRTGTDRLHLLHERLQAWVDSQSRDFAPGFDVRVSDIIDVNQLILSIWLPHKGNWQDLGKRFQRKTRFMIALKDILTELEIRYELPAQRFTQSREAAQDGFLISNNSGSVMQITPQTFNPRDNPLSRSNSQTGVGN